MSREKSNLEKAVELMNDRWLESLPNPEDLPDYEYSEEHKRIIDMIIKGEIRLHEDLENARRNIRKEQ